MSIANTMTKKKHNFVGEDERRMWRRAMKKIDKDDINRKYWRRLAVLLSEGYTLEEAELIARYYYVD